jgi:F-type H+-transporting ATPase subunit b
MQTLTRLALATLLSLSPLALKAQAHEAAPAEKHEAPAAGHEAQPAGHEALPAEGHAGSEATHDAAAHEAAPGHGEAHGGAHHGPAMKLFGKEYGNLGAFLVQLLNFVLYGAALFFLLKGALSVLFKSRKEELETLLAQAEKDRAEGEAQMKEMEAKMAGLEGELAGILSKAKSDAEAEKQHVLEAAKAEATLILAQAQAEIGQQKRQAEQELRALVAELAVEGASRRLEAKLQGPDAGKALDRAIQQIGGAQ